MSYESGKHILFTQADSQKIKGFAIIIMLIHHCFLSPERYTDQMVLFAPFTESFFNAFALQMKICVAIFVFISAFGITRSYLNTNSTTTYIILRRILKLHLNFFFVFWFVQIIGSIITPGRFTKIYHLGSGFRHIIQASLYYLIDMLGLSNLLGTPTYLTTFWYMSLALIIIIAVPVFIKIQNCLGTALLFALIIIISAVFKIDSTNTFAYFPIYAGSIFWGIVSARYDIIPVAGNCRRT